MSLELFPLERSATHVAPGAVHVPDYLDESTQRRLVVEARDWMRPPAPMRAVRLPGGGTMTVKGTCLGRYWVPYRYTDVAEDTDGAPVKPLPGWLAQLGADAVAHAYRDQEWGRRYVPDAALVNFYEPGAQMGLHQDKEEQGDEPVVSFSIGASCIFRFGNTETRGRPWTDIELRSGDLFVFGGPSRLAYHGVPRLIAGTDRGDLGIASGRLNITLRMTRLADRAPRRTQRAPRRATRLATQPVVDPPPQDHATGGDQ
ncbi:MAG: alpha-ketoglutarate-dependent dioxygenase AlkB [Microthrixaceae bacterium]|nr:alpha-ketoglutarate-dependent dioxygenase AlkB [Microthrixaceae bacterium]